LTGSVTNSTTFSTTNASSAVGSISSTKQIGVAAQGDKTELAGSAVSEVGPPSLTS
jgi:hypothetical protein